MRPLHGLILLLALVALLVGGLFWLGGSRDSKTLERSNSEPVAAPLVPAPEAELSATDAPNALAERAAQPGAAVHLESATSATETADGLGGRVVGPDGKPVPGAKVFVGVAGDFDFLPLDVDAKLMPGAKRANAVSDADGRFQLALSGETHVRLAVRASGFAPLDAERTLARGERELGDVALEQGVVLEGRVIDQTGRAVADAQLFSRPRTNGFSMEMAGNRGRPPLATTDAQGRFKIDMLASGPWRMLVTTDEHPDKTFDGETDRPGIAQRNLEFALEEGAQISGHVTGAAADVLGKLQVTAQQRGENDEGGDGLVFGPGGFTGPRKAKVAADGSFSVRGLKPGSNYRLEAQKSESTFFGFGMPSKNGVSAKSGDRGIEVPYKPAGAIVCQVVDAASGKPVTEMDVKAGYGWMMPLTESEGKPKTTFPDGNVRFDRLPPRFGGGGGSGLKLRIDATGYKSYESPELEPVQGKDTDLGVVRLERAPVCRVQVLDLSSGAPIAGAEVTLRQDGGEANPFGGVQIRRGRGGRTMNDQGVSQGTTAADGTVVLSSFPGKQATLKVKHEDYALWQSGPLTLAEGADHQETVKLARGGEVQVSVRDSKGQPVPGVEIEHASPTGEQDNPWMRRMSGGGSTRTDSRGEYVFTHLEAGAHRFRIAGDGGPGAVFASPGGGGAVSMSFSVDASDAPQAKEEPWTSADVLEGAQAAVKLIAPMRGTLVGRVREGGKALAGASITLDLKQEGGGGFMGMPFFGGGNGPRTNGSGEYKIEGKKPGKYTIHVSHPSRAMNWDGELELAEGEQRFDIELPIAIVEGRVTGPDGKPIAGARVSAEKFQEKGDSQQTMVMSFAVAGDSGDVMSFGGSGGAEPVRTDSDGRYTLRGLLTDTDLVVHVTGKEFSPANSEKFRCAPDQTVRGIDVSTKQAGLLEVRVTRAGQPAAGVLVEAHHKGKDGKDDNQSEVTGADGSAHFAGLEPGTWEYDVLDISNPDGNPDPQPSERKPVEVKPGETAKAAHELH